MTHDLRTEEIRPVQSKDGKTPATMYAWCVCGGWAKLFPTFHRGPILDGFFDHLGRVCEYCGFDPGEAS